jgi:prolyl oligopeptidase
MKRAAAAVVAAVSLGACSSESRPSRTAAVVPATRVEPVSETLDGVVFTDNYRWLEGPESPANAPLPPVPEEIAAWTDAQNNYTRTVIDALPTRREIEERLRPLLVVGSVTAPVVRGNRYFLARRSASQAQPVISWREGALGADRPLVDPASIDPAGMTAIAWFSPSEDGRQMAFATYTARGGSPTLRLMEVDTGTLAPLEIPNTPQGVQWLPDGSGFVYQQIKNPKDPATLQSRFHKMGTPPASDPVLARAPFTRLSRDGRWLLLGYPTKQTSNDLWLADFAAARKGGALQPKPVSVGAEGRVAGNVIDGTLFLHTTQGAPNGRVVAVATTDPGQARWREIVPERRDAVIESVAFTRDVVAVTYRANAATAIEVFDPSGAARGSLRLPGIGLATLTVTEDRPDAYVTFTSFNYPPTVFRVDLAHPTAAPVRLASPDAAVDPASVEVERVSYPAKDGTAISMFLVRKAGIRPSGDAPALIVAHGALGTSMTPAFTAAFFPWFESGGLLAVPHLRGGGEYGDAWHEAAMRDKKQTAVDDLISAADWLVANRHASASRLAVTGGAHGALTAAVAVMQHPDRFRAAILVSPLTDMLRYQRFGAGAYWIPEYGSADDPGQAAWLRAYSPYHHVTAGTRYPAILITASETTGPVHPMHARKFAAALQAATGSDRRERPILLRVDRPRAGDSPLELHLRDLVDQRTFLMWQVGLSR